MAPATPWAVLNTITVAMFGAKTDIILNKVKKSMPSIITLLLPVVSAIFPNGTLMVATASIYAVTIHPRNAALTSKYSPISGIARFSALPIKVVMNAVVKETLKVDFCSSVCFFVFSALFSAFISPIMHPAKFFFKSLFVALKGSGPVKNSCYGEQKLLRDGAAFLALLIFSFYQAFFCFFGSSAIASRNSMTATMANTMAAIFITFTIPSKSAKNPEPYVSI